MWKTIFIGAGLIFFSLAVHDASAFAERPITLEEAYRSADLKSDQIHFSQEDLIQAEEETRRARSLLYPKVTADLSYLRRPDALSSRFGVLRPESEEQFNLTLEQPLYSGGRATATYHIAQTGTEGRRLDLRLTRENLLFNVARAYYEALKARKNAAIEEGEVKRLEAHRNAAEKRAQVGEATKTILLRAEAELSSAQARLIRAKNNVSAALDQLALLAKLEEPFDLVDPPLISLVEKSEKEWIETARENRVDLQRRSLQIDMTRQGIDFVKGAFYPTLSLEGRYSWVDQNPKSSFLVQNDRTAMVKLSFPIFEGGLRRAEISQAKSRFRQSEIDKALLSDQIDVEVRRAVLDLSALTSELHYLKDQVAFARDNFSLVSRQFAVGLATHIDVLDANATLLDAERRLSNTFYDREVTTLALGKTAGVFLGHAGGNR